MLHCSYCDANDDICYMICIQHMIWEVDENSDNMVDYEEFQLTYYRNIHDESGNEPCAFFSILEVFPALCMTP